MDKELLDFLREYLKKVDTVKTIMFNDFDMKNKKDLIEKRPAYEKGNLKIPSNHKYMFHGRGCYFTSDEFEIDWDFGCYDIWCGINPGLFFKFVANNYGLEDNLSNYNMIEDSIKGMVEDGILVKKHGLYYFVNDK